MKVLFISLSLIILTSAVKDEQKDINIQSKNGLTESRVTISVGEKPGFVYTVNGRTNSENRIGVSGDYYNDELHYYGSANLYLGVSPDIYAWHVVPRQNTLYVTIVNYFREEFYFEVLVPRPVSVYHDLGVGQFNETSLIVTGPSRSSLYYPRVNTIKTKVLGTFKRKQPILSPLDIQNKLGRSKF